jgi:hypothetical protein
MHVVVLLLALAVTCFAQAPANARKVHLRLLAFDAATTPAQSYVFDRAAPGAPGTEAPIKGYLNHEGLSIEVLGNELVFAKSGDSAAAQNEAQRIATATLPATGNQFLLIFLPAGESFQILPMDDSLAQFPAGSYRVINLSRSAVRLSLEQKPFDLKPGQNLIIQNPPVQENQHSAMTATTFVDGKPHHRIGSGLWPHPGEKRSIQVLFDNPRTKRTEMRGFRDISPPAAGQSYDSASVP